MWAQEKEDGEIHIVASARSISSCKDLLKPLNASQLEKVTKVDVSFNSLKCLDGLATLKSMRYLDIRCNGIPSMQALVPVLQKCNGLRHLRMKVCGRWARDPKFYMNDICREVPALQTVDGIKNNSVLSEQQQRAQRFLDRVFGIGPNEIADVNLNGKEICGEDFACVLRALSHLPVLRLQMQDNPASQVRGYRCYVVSMVKSLKVLDGQPVSSDERVNATREVSRMSKEVASVHQEVDKQRVMHQMLIKSPILPESTSNGTSSYRDIYQNSSFVIEELNVDIQQRNQLTPFSAVTPSTTSPIAPRKLSFSENSMKTASLPRPGTKGKINLMLVASKPLREDIVEFLEDDKTGATLVKNLDMPEIFKGLENAPIQAVSGRVWSKLEILVNYLQIYRLIFRFSIPWPAIWFGLNNESDITAWLFHYVPSLIFQGQQKSDKTNLIIFTVFLFLPIILLGIYFASFVDKIIPQKLDKIIVKITGYSWKMLRKRAALFGITVSYLPLANSMLSMLIPSSDGTMVVIKGLPHTPWPTSISNFQLSLHWPMIVAFAAGLVYIVGIPCVCALLITKGSKEASTAHAVEEVGKQIIDLRQNLYLAREKGYAAAACYEAEIEDCISNRERAYDLLYAKAVREYHKAQTYLYEDYHEKAKYYKIVIMVWKIAMLINVLGTGALAYTVNAKFIPVQTTSGLLLVGGMLIIAAIKRPFQASSENMLEIALIGANLVNATIAFLLSIVAQARSDEIMHDIFMNDEVSGNVTGCILILVNALAVFYALGVIMVTPWLNRISRIEISRIKDYNLKNAASCLLQAAGTNAKTPGSSRTTKPSNTPGPSTTTPGPSSSNSKYLTPRDFHSEVAAIAKVCNSMPVNSGSSGGSTSTGGSSINRKAVMKNKSIILQLYDGDYGSPFYKRLENLKKLTQRRIKPKTPGLGHASP